MCYQMLQRCHLTAGMVLLLNILSIGRYSCSSHKMCSLSKLLKFVMPLFLKEVGGIIGCHFTSLSCESYSIFENALGIDESSNICSG